MADTDDDRPALLTKKRKKHRASVISASTRRTQAMSMSTASSWHAYILRPPQQKVLHPTAGRYYRFVAALEAKLPIGRERGGLPLVFSWTDAFQPSQHRCAIAVCTLLLTLAIDLSPWLIAYLTLAPLALLSNEMRPHIKIPSGLSMVMLSSEGTVHLMHCSGLSHGAQQLQCQQ